MKLLYSKFCAGLPFIFLGCLILWFMVGFIEEMNTRSKHEHQHQHNTPHSHEALE